MNFVEGLTTFLGGVGGTVLLLMPGYVFGRTINRGARVPQVSDLTFVASAAIGGIIVHALMLRWTLQLAKDIAADLNVWIDRLNEINRGLPKSELASLEFPDLPYVQLVLWLVVVLIAIPAILGVIVSLTLARGPNWLRQLIDRVGLTPAVRPTEAWTWAFQHLYDAGEGSWVRVRIKESDQIFIGKLGEMSLASSDAAVRDLYLEEMWTVDESGQPGPQPPANKGVWISGEYITSVEFF